MRPIELIARNSKPPDGKRRLEYSKAAGCENNRRLLPRLGDEVHAAVTRKTTADHG